VINWAFPYPKDQSSSLFSSLLYSIAETVSFADALWWAISITSFFTQEYEIDKDKQIEDLHTKLEFLINKMNELDNNK